MDLRSLSQAYRELRDSVRGRFYERECRIQEYRVRVGILPVSCARELQVRLHPRASLQGETKTLYLVLQLSSESTHKGEVSLHNTAWLAESTACTSYISAPRTAVHVVIRDSQEIPATVTFSGQHGTTRSKRIKIKKQKLCKLLQMVQDI